MNITEVQKRLMNLFDKNHKVYNRAYGLALYYEAEPETITDSYHLAVWYENALADVKFQLLRIFDSVLRLSDTGLRVCTICGKFFTEGYILHGLDDYACSRECAIEVFRWNGSNARLSGEEAEAKLNRALEENGDDNFWTQWYQEL